MQPLCNPMTPVTRAIRANVGRRMLAAAVALAAVGFLTWVVHSS
jgi:hypothetical protein